MFEYLHESIIMAAAANPSMAGKLVVIRPLIEAMRAQVPKEGADYQKVITVLSGPKEKIKAVHAHRHPEHTVLYYVHPGVVRIEGEDYMPERGEILYLKPETWHEVPKHDGVRLSVAMLVDL